MPGLSGIEATRRILAERPETNILVLTMFDDDSSVYAAVRAGARGYLLKGADQEDVERAIRTVASGGAVFGNAIAAKLITYFDSNRNRPFPELTPREHDVLQHLANGLNNQAIADELNLSLKTVRNNVSSIFTSSASQTAPKPSPARTKADSEQNSPPKRAEIATSAYPSPRTLLCQGYDEGCVT